MGNPHLRLATPATVNRTVTPRRTKNSELRSRQYLTGREVEALMDAARKNRRGHRDATMVLIAFRHGLRASELVSLRWEQVDLNRAVLHVRRVKGGHSQCSPLERRGATRVAPLAPGERRQPVRVLERARRTLHHCRVRPDDGAGRRGCWA
jgi:integrase